MYTLYWAKQTGALAPQIALEEIGVDYQRVVLTWIRGGNARRFFGD